jgi:hypothetical protein
MVGHLNGYGSSASSLVKPQPRVRLNTPSPALDIAVSYASALQCGSALLPLTARPNLLRSAAEIVQ